MRLEPCGFPRRLRSIAPAAALDLPYAGRILGEVAEALSKVDDTDAPNS